MPNGGRWTRRAWLAASTAGFLRAAETPSSIHPEPGAEFVAGVGWRRTPIDRIGPISYFIDKPQPSLGGRKGDAELARWALEAWDRAVSGRLCFYPEEAKLALVRVYWGQVGDGLGRMLAIPVGDLRGGEVYVEPDPASFDLVLKAMCDADPAMRDLIVYRTVLHEIGHALGLVHTTEVEDVMYFGGDVGGYYNRYRASVDSRRAMKWEPGFSAMDLERIREKYPERPHRRAPRRPDDSE